jgi:hypothetical protein
MIEAPLRHGLSESCLLPLFQLLILNISQIHVFQHRSQKLCVLRVLCLVAAVVISKVAAPQDLNHFALGICVRMGCLEHVRDVLSVERLRAVGAVPLIAGGGAVAGAAPRAPVVGILNLADKTND